MKPLSAGSEIDAWCTRCRMDLGHRVVAMVGGAPKRVICLTCNSEHNYRRAISDAKKPNPARPRIPLHPARGTRAQQEQRDEWSKRVLGQASGVFTRYGIDRTFHTGDLILHAKFGEGYVAEVREDGKVEVVFRDGKRTLAHRAAPG